MYASALRLDGRALLGLAVPVLMGVSPAPAPVPTFTPPTDPRDFADPFVLHEGADFYAFATGARGLNFQVAQSRDLASWTLLADALPKLASWASTEPGYTWAPAILPRRDRYVLYYTARHKASGFQCISRAVAAAPAGPYVDDSTEPFVCEIGDPKANGAGSRCGSIDPSPFVDGDGRVFLIWKSDENSAACHAPTHLWSQPLSDDGLDLSGEPALLLTMDQAWETPIIEGPSMVRRAEGYYLFYSANWYDSARYAIGYAKCTGARGPCTKATTNGPLLQSGGADLGPGGQEFFTDGSERTWMAYHAWTAPHAAYASGGARTLRLAPVVFEGGAPRVDLSGALTVGMHLEKRAND
jgi:beta-xylosidase